MEIERKFLLLGGLLENSRLPMGSGQPIVQGYVFVDPEVRLRSKGGRYFQTYKGKGNLSRDEWEVEIPEWVFNLLWPKTEGRRVEKFRYELPFQSHILEVDIYHGRLSGLITMECEFESEAEADAFVLPEWALDAVDVTADRRYKNKNLAVNGLPE